VWWGRFPGSCVSWPGEIPEGVVVPERDEIRFCVHDVPDHVEELRYGQTAVVLWAGVAVAEPRNGATAARAVS